MSKCRICRENETEWAWQPFGPSESLDSFMLPGSHYRGFPVINCCNYCKKQFQQHSLATLVFFYKHVLYRISQAGGIEKHGNGGWSVIVPPNKRMHADAATGSAKSGEQSPKVDLDKPAGSQPRR